MKYRKLTVSILVSIMMIAFCSSSLALSNSFYWDEAFDLQRSSSHEEHQTMVIQRVIYEYLNYHDMSSSFVDGQFGPNTRAKVILFQSLHSHLDDDGIVGSQTWETLQGKTSRGNDIPYGSSGNLYGYYVSRIRIYSGQGYGPENPGGYVTATYFGYRSSNRTWFVRLRTDSTLYQIN